MHKIKIAIVFGGKSPEHNTSIAGGFSIITDINRDKYDIYPIYIKQNGQFANFEESIETLYRFLNNSENEIYLDKSVSIKQYEEILDMTIKNKRLKYNSVFENIYNKEFDIFFPIFHGKNGEDGSIQGLLDFLQLPYVGCGIAGSAICIDKEIAKKICEANGVKVVPYIVYKNFNWQSNKSKSIEEIEKKLGYPLFVKPASLGSSIGITKAKNRDELINGMDIGFGYDTKVLVEKGLNVKEYSVSIIGNNSPIASEISLFKSLNPDFFDFESKYSKVALSSETPAKLDSETTKIIKDKALDIYKFLEIYGFARVDFFVSDDMLYLNEVNTIPGLDIDGTFFKQWKKSNIEKSKLIDILVECGFEKFKEKESLK